MDYYVVIKKATIKTGGGSIHKDTVISADDLGLANAARLLKGGYIKLLAERPDPPDGNARTDEELTPYTLDEEFLSPEEVDRLLKPQLVEYAGHIGYAGFKPNISAADLKKQINQFIAEAQLNDESEDDAADESEYEDGTEE